MSNLSQAVEHYLAIRRNLGFELREPAVVLHRFTEFAETEGASRFAG